MAMYIINPDKNIQRPKLWDYINAPIFEFCVRLLLINSLKLGPSLPFIISFYLNVILLCVYTYCYSSIIFETMSNKVLKYWMRPVLKSRGQYYFPSIILIYLCICFIYPLSLILFFPYNRLYEIHKRIVFLLSNEQ